MIKRFFATLCLLSLILYPTAPFKLPVAHAAAPGSVVINEITWMGSVDSTSDEWIELHNTTSSPVDLTNWTIDDDGGSAVYNITSGSISAGGYFLIEDSENATSIAADAIINISLGNTGDSLVLKDELGAAVDTINSSGGPWPAGDNTNKLSMERIDPAVNGDDPANWANATFNNGSTGSGGSTIGGTPGSQNSVFAGAPVGLQIDLQDLATNPLEGDTFNVQVDITGASDVLSFGLDVLYDDTTLTYISAAQGTFLSENGATQTSFYADLENGIPGKVVIGESRLTVPPSGVSGSGDLFTMTFQATGSSGTSSALSFDVSSFVSDTSGDIQAAYDSDTVTIDAGTVDPVTNLSVTQGTSRYELDLTWNTPATGADSYKVLKRNALGSLTEITTTTNTFYTDNNNLVPNHLYEYQVIAVRGTTESLAVDGQGTDSRGLTGDNTRSDRVDGRDLESLARLYTLALADANFDPLVDTTYDGIIDGSDLIDIGANWALTY